MLGNKNALILMWTGNGAEDELVTKIAQVLVSAGVTIPEMLKIVYKDEDAIAKALVVDAAGRQTLKIDVEDDVAKALQQAIIYIGKRFEVSLSDTKAGLVPFALELQSELSKARTNAGFNFLNSAGDEKALINAVEIIATTSATVPQSLARKYHITKDVISIVKHIHNQFA